MHINMHANKCVCMNYVPEGGGGQHYLDPFWGAGQTFETDLRGRSKFFHRSCRVNCHPYN